MAQRERAQNDLIISSYNTSLHGRVIFSNQTPWGSRGIRRKETLVQQTHLRKADTEGPFYFCKFLVTKRGCAKIWHVGKTGGNFFSENTRCTNCLIKNDSTFFLAHFFFRKFFLSQSNRHVKMTIFIPKNALNDFFGPFMGILEWHFKANFWWFWLIWAQYLSPKCNSTWLLWF